MQLGLPTTTAMADDAPLGITGTLKYHERFASKFVDARNVNVWLPPDYDKQTSQRYPVVYMHDGQNLHDPKTSFLGVDWGVDEALTELITAGKVPPTIVVGIWNTPRRVAEYLPAKMILDQPEDQRAKLLAELAKAGIKLEEKQLLADDYLKFIVKELKPYIDEHYRIRPAAAHTSIMGSSAGALISLYAVCEYPDVFGGAGCVSTHWPVCQGLMIDYTQNHLPDPKTHRLYFDFGTETLDAPYEPYQDKMDAALLKAGYERDVNWLTRKFVGADHSERSWRKRVHIPLEFLLREGGASSR